MEYIDYGYCRISTARQNIDRQARNILELYPKAHIVKETFTGTQFQGRKDWNNLYKQALKQAKTKKVRIIFDAVSRFSRNADEGCELYEELFNNGIELVFIKEPHINTEVYKQAIQNQIQIKLNTGNKATDEFISNIMDALNQYTVDLAKTQIRIAFEQSEKEVLDLHKRTSEGLHTAKLNGKRVGLPAGSKLTTKKSILAKEIIKKHCVDFGGSLSDKECMVQTQLARNTYYKYKREIKENL